MLCAVAVCNSTSDVFTTVKSAQCNDISLFSLYHCFHGCLTCLETHVEQQLLSIEEEKALARALTWLIKQEFSPSLRLLCHMMCSMTQAQKKISVSDVEKNWSQHFVNRHKNVVVKAWSASLSSKWAETENSEIIEPFLFCLQRLHQEYDVASEDV